MSLPSDCSSCSRSRTIIFQSESSKVNSDSNKVIFRLGWTSFILGFCAFFLHYISLYRLESSSTLNAGIISSFVLIIASLACVAAAYREKSYRCFVHAQVWSFIANIILTPGLIAVSITALINETQNISPLCQLHASYMQSMFLSRSEKNWATYPCLASRRISYLTVIINAIQLIIGVVCFVVHVFLLTVQRNVIKTLNIKDTDPNNRLIIHAQPIITNTNYMAEHNDTPPKYEDLSPTHLLSE